jgi:hypothetical protein
MQVYRIFHKQTNKSYIGITKWDFKTRYSGCKWDKWTHNKHLKRAVKKYGLDNFEYEILWSGECGELELIELEKLYIDQYNSFIPNGFNLTKGGGKFPKSRKEYEFVDFSGSTYFVKDLKAFCVERNLNYAAMLNMVNNISKTSQGFSLSSSENIKDPNEVFKLQNIETGKIAKVKRSNIVSWSRREGLNPDCIATLINGKIKSSQSWKLTQTETLPFKYGPTKFKNPNGEIVLIENIYKFCLENSLDRKGFYHLITGKSLTYKGWTLPMTDEELNLKKAEKLGKNIEILDANNNIISVKNISQFCRARGLNRNSFQALVSGKINKYHGYKISK